jgi:hypothetical protein
MTAMVAWLGLAVALLAAGAIWKLNQELATATRRLDRYNKALFDANDQIRKLQEQVSEESAQLRVALRRQSGMVSFVPEMTVRETLLLHPQAEQVLAGFHLGGCSHCAVEPDATLAQVCTQSGVQLDQLMGNLNLLTGGIAVNGNGAPTLVKLPNVALEF